MKYITSSLHGRADAGGAMARTSRARQAVRTTVNVEKRDSVGQFHTRRNLSRKRPAGRSARISREIKRKNDLRALDILCRWLELSAVAKKLTPIKDKLSKTQILDQIAESTGLTRKQVASVVDSLTEVIEAHVNKRAVGEFVLPGLLKISTVRKPAVKARKGINPFTKEEVMFKAKPASTAVKVRPLKKLKDMVL
jgi:nucleoid DNA-binding protein